MISGFLTNIFMCLWDFFCFCVIFQIFFLYGFLYFIDFVHECYMAHKRKNPSRHEDIPVEDGLPHSSFQISELNYNVSIY